MPGCGESYKSLGYLAQHVFKLAELYPRKRFGKRVAMRHMHYNWLKERNVTIRYESVKRYLERLLRQGSIKQI